MGFGTGKSANIRSIKPRRKGTENKITKGNRIAKIQRSITKAIMAFFFLGTSSSWDWESQSMKEGYDRVRTCWNSSSVDAGHRNPVIGGKGGWVGNAQ